jgi:hypothetical protein
LITRSDFTPRMAECAGMRLPTIRSKHLESVIHTLLSTTHALVQPYNIAHYHTLGAALFPFLLRLLGKKRRYRPGPELARKEMGTFCVGCAAAAGRTSVGAISQYDDGGFADSATTLSRDSRD